MTKEISNNIKSVSRTLDKGYGKKIYSSIGTRRGNLLHHIKARFFKEVLKTGANARVSHTILNQRTREVRNKILAEVRNNKKLNMYYKDVNTLLKILYQQIVELAKNYAKENNWSVIPIELEKQLFGGIISFEQEEIGVIEGAKISARIDEMVLTDDERLIVREFKSYPFEGEDPSNPESKYYRDLIQACIYGIILEENTGMQCQKVVLIYFPNKIIEYDFTDKLKVAAIDFIRENGLDALEFKVDTQDESGLNSSRDVTAAASIISLDEEKVSKGSSEVEKNVRAFDALGWVNTDKSKPMELVNNKENKMEGYLWADKAEYVKDGDLVAVERQDGIRIICIIELIRCYEENASIVLKSLNEKVFAIKLNPIVELHPEGPRSPRPQTIIQGKITPLREWEFYEFKKIPQNGIPFGWLHDIDQEYKYHFNPLLYYQGIFMGGTQGTGKTSAIRFMTLSTAPQANCPAIIIFDAEGEFSNLPCIPSIEESMKLMAKWDIDPVESENIEIIHLTDETDWCLSLNSIDPKHLLLFLHELPSVSSTLLQRIIQDIIYDYPNRTFTFTELHTEILRYMTLPAYRLNASVRDAITRSLLSITLDLFDRLDAEPIDIEQMLVPGKITVLDCFDLDDDQQRIVALYFLAVFHKYKMKRDSDIDTSDIGVIFVLDEVTRIMPKLLANTDYQKRILHFLSEIQHRGRKRRYGVIYATQHPKDIKKELVDLCNTKIFFLIEGSGCAYLKDYLNSEQREQLKRLPVGHAFILCKGKHEPQIIKFPYLN
ncbi:MAG: helicase HerA domain-containing protein [Promethearchaeota archaeon]